MERLFEEAGRRRIGLPSGWYSRVADCAFLYNEDVEHWADRVDETLTLLRALEDDRIVGAEVRGIRALPRNDGVFRSVVKRGFVEAATLLLFALERQRRRRGKLPRSVEARYGEALGILRGGVALREGDLDRR